MSVETGRDPVSVSIAYDHDVNYALQQNHVPIVRRLNVRNTTDRDLDNLLISITTLPEFTVPFETAVLRLPAGAELEIAPVDVMCKAETLAAQNERETGALLVTISSGETILLEKRHEISVLAHDEWGGSAVVPEIIAAFVTPSHPYIFKIIRRASEILGEWSGNPSIDAYQSGNPGRAREIVAAIYAALQEYGIAYTPPPASFEDAGQKIRTPDMIVEYRQATCLDLAVMFAACVEAAGLHPLIVMVREHAFVGAWLIDQVFAEAVQDDVTLLTKRCADGVQEICVVETTALTAGKNCTFDQAADLACQRLRTPDDFHYVVDVKRARMSRILPLPSRVRGKPVDDGGAAAPVDSTHAAPRSFEPPAAFTDSGMDEASRLQNWERRLLDLSLNNTLLNFRPTATGIQIMTPSIDRLENELAGGREFEVHPRPTDWIDTPRDAATFRVRTHSDPEVLLLDDEFRMGRLRADVPERDLPARLTQLYRSARTSMEENGANTLFLALGMLAWCPRDEKRARYAPLMLLPMELVRKSVRTGFILRHSDDDPIFNVTLLEMLRQDFGIDVRGLDELPRDDVGIDVKTVLTIIRRAVMHITGWDVVESASLGLFSFNKFVMWHDLRERADELKNNDVVKSLMAGMVQFDQMDGGAPEDLDAACARSSIMCPISADSSQLAAIHAVDCGRNIVLHGPPGTGKSQTITNMIANALAKGQTVLFVAEKMAALSVVQNRLEKIGIGNFCLELHSNKSRKIQVLEQLRASLQCGPGSRPAHWEAEAARLGALKAELDKYVDALHATRPIGHSIYDGLARLAEVSTAPDSIRFDADAVSALTPESLALWTRLAHDLEVAARQCGTLADSPWAGCAIRDYSPNVRAAVGESACRVRETNAAWKASLTPLASCFHLLNNMAGLDTLKAHLALFDTVIDGPRLPDEMVLHAEWKVARADIEKLLMLVRERDRLRASVLARYQRDILEIDAAGIIREIRTLSQRWFLPWWTGMRRIKRLMKAYELRGGPGIGAPESDLAEIRRLQEFQTAIDRQAENGRRLLGDLWQAGECDLDDANQLLPALDRINQAIATIARGDPAVTGQVRQSLIGIRADAAGDLNASHIRRFVDTGHNAMDSWHKFVEQIQMSGEFANAMAAKPDWFAVIDAASAAWAGGLDLLRDWCAWNRVRQDAFNGGLAAVVRAVETGSVPVDRVSAASLHGIYSIWVEREIVGDPVLAEFSRGIFEDKIQTFRDLDDTWSRLTCQKIYARLAARVPRPARDLDQKGELGILARELQKQRRHMALRQLFQAIPHVLARLKPCMLMSPISVAQYLDPSHPAFDLVIFDEASQVPTCDAVGAIARGSQVVIVGDPKQLPPTTFFTRTDSDDDDDATTYRDLESILDDCLAINMDESHLLWHYRSRHESLISFSNARYYKNQLLTFPSPDDLTPKVRAVFVDGRYERGGSKQNRAEAQAVVNEVVRRLKDPVLSRFSIGIVTFNATQQKLIEDIIDEQLRRTPALEKFFTEGVGDGREPVFVKNLENVQGDERDVILFSIGYGPDKSGRVSMNFGPVNKEGGQRRLNVAVSRARNEMVVFTSIHADQIDTSRTTAWGVADLRAFIAYAERGVLPVIPGQAGNGRGDDDRRLENRICAALADRGHAVRVGVGASGYRVDIGIVDPKCPGRYLLGVILDGPSYRDARTTRDRVRLREDKLRDLGWRLHRVWSPDWWENQAREIARIETALRDAASHGPNGTTDRGGTTDPCAPSAPGTTATSGVVPGATGSATPSGATGDGHSDHALSSIPGESTPLESTSTSHGDAARLYVPPPPLTGDFGDVPGLPKSVTTLASKYRVCELEREPRDQAEFYAPTATGLIAAQAMKVTDVEGPISHPLLARRVINAWGMNKIGNVIDERITDICHRMKLTRTTHLGRTWYWPLTATPAKYADFRIPDDPEAYRREAEDIPPEEVANAMRQILKQQISLPEEILVRETARLFGIRRVGPAVDECFRYAIKLVESSKDAETDAGGRVVWTGKD